MTTTDFILALDSATRRCVYEKDLFCGGCAYASAQIAKKLELLGISYQVIMYDNRKNAFERNQSCAHLAIRVKIDSQELFIGGEYRDAFRCKIFNLGQIPSSDIMKYYKAVREDKGWNRWYDVRYNSTYSRICNSVYKKFTEI